MPGKEGSPNPHTVPLTKIPIFIPGIHGTNKDLNIRRDNGNFTSVKHEELPEIPGAT